MSSVRAWRRPTFFADLTSCLNSGGAKPCQQAFRRSRPGNSGSWRGGWVWWFCKGKVGSFLCCRFSSPESAPLPTWLLVCQTILSWLRLLVCACRLRLRPGSSQAAFIDHLLCAWHTLQRKLFWKWLHQWSRLGLCCSHVVFLESHFKLPRQFWISIAEQVLYTCSLFDEHPDVQN